MGERAVLFCVGNESESVDGELRGELVRAGRAER